MYWDDLNQMGNKMADQDMDPSSSGDYVVQFFGGEVRLNFSFPCFPLFWVFGLILTGCLALCSFEMPFKREFFPFCFCLNSIFLISLAFTIYFPTFLWCALT